jgi:hypothetical protein
VLPEQYLRSTTTAINKLAPPISSIYSVAHIADNAKVMQKNRMRIHSVERMPENTIAHPPGIRVCFNCQKIIYPLEGGIGLLSWPYKSQRRN